MLAKTLANTPPLLLAPASRWDRRHMVNGIATGVIVGCAAAAVLILLLILSHVVIQGLPALSPDFFIQRPLPPGEVGGGVAPAIVGTLEMLLVAVSSVFRSASVPRSTCLSSVAGIWRASSVSVST